MTTRYLAILAAAALWACDGGNGGGTDTAAPPDPGVGDEGPAPDLAVEDVPTADRTPADEGPADTGPADVAKDDGPPPVSAECAAVESGKMNGLTVDGTKRYFYFNAPAGATAPGGKWPLVFLWHGFAGVSMSGGVDNEAPSFRSLLAPNVGDERFPFLLVTPTADGQAFLDWNILEVYDADTNADIRLFEEVSACLDGRFGVDPDHVHSLGFSAGAIMTDLIARTRGDRIASTLTWSGAYLDDPANAVENFEVIWPDPGPSSGWTQVVFRGGATDVWEIPGMVRATFDTWTSSDIPWLNGLGHDVIECPHNQGHTPPMPYNPSYVLEFFRDHPRGVTASPYAAGLPASFPAGCVFHAKTN